jgi:hypothetical protein
MVFIVFFCLSAGSVNEDEIFWSKIKTEEKGATAKLVGVSGFSHSDALVCKSCLSLLFKPSVGCTKASLVRFLSSYSATVF